MLITDIGSPAKKKVKNFGFEPTPVISLRLSAYCDVPVGVNDLNLRLEEGVELLPEGSSPGGGGEGTSTSFVRGCVATRLEN